MGRNRRNKRSSNTNKIESKRGATITAIVSIIIIIACIGIIMVKNHISKLELAKQRELLNKEIATIFEQGDKELKQETPTEEAVKPDTVANISVVGDILCNKDMINDAKTQDSYSFAHMFENITSIIEKSDISIGTMETNFTNEAFSDYIKCNSPKEFAQDVKNSGIDLVSIAHNHSLDYGFEGLKTTKAYLEELGYETVGARTNTEETRYIVKDVKGIKIAFLAYTYGLNKEDSIAETDKQYVNIFNKDMAKQDLENAKQESDFICVMMHWGEVNNQKTTAEQEELASFLIENGANIIVGAHPAVIEPMEVRQNANEENVFIAYSVGNYISYLGYEYSSLEMILDIQIRKDGKTEEVTLDKVTYTPIYMLDNGKKAENRFTLIDMKETAKEYANGNTDIINEKTYKKLIKGLEVLEEVIRSKIEQ